MAMKFPKEDDKPKHNFARTLAKKYEVIPYLDDFLSNEIVDFSFAYEPKEKDTAWHPSGHCLTAPSELLAYAKGGYLVDRKTNSTQQKIFAVGHYWHQLLQFAAVQTGIAQKNAIEVRGFYGWDSAGEWVEPHRDGMNGGVIWKSDPRKGGYPSHDWADWHWSTGAGDIAPCVTDNWTGVLDFKTMSGAQFRSPVIPAWAAGKYEAQINIYMDYFNLDSGIILTVCKDTPHDMREFKFERNQSLIDAIYTKWKFVSQALDAGEDIDATEDEFWDLDEFLTGPIE